MANQDHAHEPNVVSLIGEITMRNAASHGDLLCNLLDLADETEFFIDLSQVEDLEPEGVAMMRWVHRHGVALGTDVWWVGLTPPHLEVLEQTGLARSLRCRPSDEGGNHAGFTPR